MPLPSSPGKCCGNVSSHSRRASPAILGSRTSWRTLPPTLPPEVEATPPTARAVPGAVSGARSSVLRCQLALVMALVGRPLAWRSAWRRAVSRNGESVVLAMRSRSRSLFACTPPPRKTKLDACMRSKGAGGSTRRK